MTGGVHRGERTRLFSLSLSLSLKRSSSHWCFTDFLFCFVDGEVYVGEDGAVTEGRVRLVLAVAGDGGWEKLQLVIAVAHSSGDGDYSGAGGCRGSCTDCPGDHMAEGGQT
jgi:hypothetical protein